MPKKKLERHILPVLREHTHISLQGKRINLVALPPVLLSWQILEVQEGVKPTYKTRVLRDDVINLISGGTVQIELLDLGQVLPVYF